MKRAFLLITLSWTSFALFGQSLENVDPANWLQWDCSPFQVTISGANTHFQQGSATSVWFSQGSNLVFASEVQTSSETQALAIFFGDFDACGLYDLHLTNPVDGPLVLPNAFDVICPDLLASVPTGASFGEVFEVTISGQGVNFETGSNTVWFTQGSNVISAANPTGLSQTELSAIVGIFDPQQCGSYDLVVDNGCGLQIGLEDALDISCDGILTGKVYFDANGNGNFDGNDTPYPHAQVRINPGSIYVGTNQSGDYSIQLPDGNYTVEVLPPSGFGVSSFPNAYAVSLGQQGYSPGLNFGLSASGGNFSDVGVSIIGTPAVAGLASQYWVAVYNHGSQTVSGALQFDIGSAGLTLLPGTVDPIALSTSGGVILWEYVDLLPGGSRLFKVQAVVPGDADPGDVLLSTALVEPIAGDDFPADNMVEYEQLVTGALVSAYKEVAPIGDGIDHLTDISSPLTYTVSFYNTAGQFPYEVLITDPLDPALDPASFQLLASSAPVEYNVIDGQLEVKFTYPFLPPISVGGLSSFGFATFAVEPISGLPVGTVVSNQAAISIDGGLSMSTNTVFNTLVDTLIAVTDPPVPDWQVVVSPNPFTDELRFAVQGAEEDLLFRLRVFDATGRQLRELSGQPAVFSVNTGRLPAGLYYYRLETEDGRAATAGKLLKN